MSKRIIQKKRKTKAELRAEKAAREEAEQVRRAAEEKRKAEFQARLDREFLERMTHVLGRTPTDDDQKVYTTDEDLVMAIVFGRAPTDEDRRICRELTWAANAGSKDYVDGHIRRST